MYSKTFSSLPQAWVDVLRHIYKQGEINVTEYGTKSRFINGVMVEITDYREEWHPHDPYCSKNRLKEYKKQFQRGYAHTFDYTYMDRFTMYACPVYAQSIAHKKSGSLFTQFRSNMKIGVDYMDQVDEVRKQLASGKRYESKRVQMITWQPSIDLFSEHPPCLQRIWFYPRSNNMVDIHIHYRSWDWFQAAEANVIGIMDMLKNEILEHCKLKINAVRLFGDNVHYYVDVEDLVKKVIE